MPRNFRSTLLTRSTNVNRSNKLLSDSNIRLSTNSSSSTSNLSPIKSNPTSLLIHSNRRRLTDYAKLVIHAASEKSRYVLFCSILLFELQLTLSSAMRVALHAVPAQHSTFHAHLSALVVAEAPPIDMPRPSSGDV